MKAGATDPFTAEILRSYLVSTVREMVGTTVRTAYSTVFAHGEDFTCALFDPEGRMVAQDQGVPVHAGSLEDAVRHVIEQAGIISEGDVFLHNDPYTGGTHQPDALILRPMFVDGRLVGFAANRGHWTDIGGVAPGGWSGTTEDVVQEGLLIPAVRLVRAGEVNEDVKKLILRNVRVPTQVWGDVQAQIASNIVAERRVRALVDRYGFEGFQAAIDAALEYSTRRFVAALEEIPDGEAVGEDVIEDDWRGEGPFGIRVRIVKRGGTVAADFAGTDGQVAAPINCSWACTKAAVVSAVLAVTDPMTPLNHGVTERITAAAPERSLVNPRFPAPTFGATADPVDRVSETVLRALGQLVPARVPAGSYATGNNVTGGGLTEEGDPFLWYSYQSGGCGAFEGKDGNSAEWHLMANSKNESMEVWETRYPLEFLEYRLVPDSGGAGRWRGGLGTERRIRILTDTRLSGISDHHRIGPRGLQGGGDGLPNGFFVERGGTRKSLQEVFGLPSPSKFSNLLLRAGDVFVSLQAGGGGFGDPRQRAPEDLERDLTAGYVSEAAARRDYGYRGGEGSR
jgi:N-methylhydantoinase B/oxoprolinase/acetone carboxylase alpha subunit